MENFDLNALLSVLKKTGKMTIGAFRDFLSQTENNAAPAEGKLSARERIVSLFDAGTFTETGAFVRRRMSEFDGEKPDEFEGVITGWGSVGGRLVFAFSQDLSRTGGAVSEAHAKKICEIYRLATENGAPVVGFFDSSGAFIPEGVRALAGYGRIMRASSRASGIVPQIAVIPGYCSGASAVIASMFDISFIVDKDGSVSVAPPFLTDGAGNAEFSAASGAVTGRVADDGAAVRAVRELLPYIPDNNEAGGTLIDTPDDANRAVDLSGYLSSRDPKVLLSAIADDGKFTELYSENAKEIVTGLCSFGGVPTGVVASNGSENGGILTSDAARKAARVVSFFDGMGIPVLTVVDSVGLERSAEAESVPYASNLAKLAAAYASASSPLVTLITGEAYGTAFTVLGSKGIGADVVMALESAKIAAMPAASAVAFLQNGEITAEVSREDLEKIWDETVANPVEAASSGEIDAIIAPNEVRQRVCSAIYMTANKSGAWNARRHPTPSL